MAARAAVEAALERHPSVPGIAAGLVARSSVDVACAGVRRVGCERRVTERDVFHLGSCTKAMTGTLCAALVDAGELSWASSVADVLGERAPMARGWAGVTLHHLMRHRGGCPESLGADGLWDRLWSLGELEDLTAHRRVLLRGVVASPPLHAPGCAFEYSNAGISIAGHMCETVGARSYEDLMQQLVFAPLGITSGGFGCPGDRRDPDANVQGHAALEDGTLVPIAPGHPAQDNPPAIHPAGGAHMTMRDWARFVQYHLRHSPQLEALHEPIPGEDYVGGWVVESRQFRGEHSKALFHNGSNTYWYAEMVLVPAWDVASIVVCNAATEEAVAAVRSCGNEILLAAKQR